jgi:archaemetzincin
MGESHENRVREMWIGAALLLAVRVSAMGFEIPGERQRLQAIGSTEGLPAILKRALDPGDGFEPVPAPGPHDWLAAHPEPGQSFEQFAGSKPNQPDRKRNVICLQPLGEFRKGDAPSLDLLREYAAAYFAMDVRVLPRLDLGDAKITTRRNSMTHNRQFLTTDIPAVLRNKIPENAFCLLGITMEDLYPEPSWNFVFGQASLRERVGVYSFARYDPAFYGQPRDKDYEKTLLRRSCRVLVHETGHMFGLLHCIYFRCVFNGSNHLAESDSRPMHACPGDLRKLHYGINFDVTRRYGALLGFYQKVGFDDEADWTKARLEWIVGPTEAKKIIEERQAKVSSHDRFDYDQSPGG